MDAKSEVKEASIEAVVIRKDGTREDLGTVSYWSNSLIKRILWRINHK